MVVWWNCTNIKYIFIKLPKNWLFFVPNDNFLLEIVSISIKTFHPTSCWVEDTSCDSMMGEYMVEMDVWSKWEKKCSYKIFAKNQICVCVCVCVCVT
jgi:hypothetical protein